VNSYHRVRPQVTDIHKSPAVVAHRNRPSCTRAVVEIPTDDITIGTCWKTGRYYAIQIVVIPVNDQKSFSSSRERYLVLTIVPPVDWMCKDMSDSETDREMNM